MMKLKFKNRAVFNEVLAAPYHFKMIQILIWLTERYEVVITSGYRHKDKGVHGTVPCRGVDIRSNIFDNPKELVGIINDVWIYDTNRKDMRCAMLHDTGSGEHIHLQVHPNTLFMGDTDASLPK